MPRFLVEVPHSNQKDACARVIKIFLTSGSHYLSHADWGCMDGDHRAWIIVEADNKDDACLVVPPALRPDARITGLNKFNLEQFETLSEEHDG